MAVQVAEARLPDRGIQQAGSLQTQHRVMQVVLLYPVAVARMDIQQAAAAEQVQLGDPQHV
jgi:hypothetical protein